MKYIIRKLNDSKIIAVTVEGTLNEAERKMLYADAIKKLSLNGCNSLLIDISKSTLSAQDTTGDAIDMAEYMKTFTLAKNTKIAILSSSPENFFKTFVVFAKIITNLDIMFFISRNDAVEWLNAPQQG